MIIVYSGTPGEVPTQIPFERDVFFNLDHPDTTVEMAILFLEDESLKKLVPFFQHCEAARAVILVRAFARSRTPIDYQSVGKKAFYVERLPDGALPIYDKNPDSTACTQIEEDSD